LLESCKTSICNIKWNISLLPTTTKPYPIIDILQTNGGILMGKKAGYW
jgi:hypothetical protein